MMLLHGKMQGLTVASDTRRHGLGCLLYIPPDEANKRMAKIFQYVRALNGIAALGAGLFWVWDATDAQLEVDDAIPTGFESGCMGIACAIATAGQYLWAQVFGPNEVAMTGSGNVTLGDAIYPSGVGTWATASTDAFAIDGGAGRFITSITATAAAGSIVANRCIIRCM